MPKKKTKTLSKEQKQEKKISILLEDLGSLENYILELFTFTPSPICFVSPIGVILEFNPAFEKISGYRFYEVVGEGVEMIFGKEQGKMLVKETLDKGEIWAREGELLTKTKKKVPISIFSRARKDEEDRIVGFFIGAFDLSEIKSTQEVLQEKIEELEKFQKVAVGRELKMIELKQELERLK